MKSSPFKFINPVLEECEFQANNGFLKEIKTGIDAQNKVNIKVNIKRNERKVSDESRFLSMQVEVGEKNDSCPFYARVRMQAVFQMPADISEELKKSFMNVNAPALLYSYIRPVIAEMTGNSMFPRYNLPFMNFTNDEE